MLIGRQKQNSRQAYFISILIFAIATLVGSSAASATLAGKLDIWPQEYTGRVVDPAVRFGKLPNGLRYAIERNATPPGQMSLRLVIGSGSLAETDQEQGLAHFLEHMAFRGSTHIADGEMTKTLARYGLTFGADSNAATSQEATIYKLDFPKSRSEDVDTGLLMFREIADNLNLSESSIDAERGVILSEERLRDTPAYREAKAQIGYLLPGQLASQRWPIGQTQIIEQATSEQLRRFYEREYRPDNAAIVAVGDFDSAAMEAKIRAAFANWKAKGDSHIPPVMGAVQASSEQADLFSEAGAPQNVQFSWIHPYDNSADTDAREDRDDVRAIATLIFNHRLEDLAHKPDAPLVAAQLTRDNLLKSADVTNLVVVAPADHWEVAMRAAIDEQQRVVRFGVTQPELDLVLAEMRSYLAAAAASASTRETPRLADAIVKNVNDDDVTRSPQQDEAELTALAARIDVAAVNAALRDMFSGSGPLLFLSTPQAPAGGAATVSQAFNAALRDKVTQGNITAAIAWPYQNFGPPGRVVERKTVADLGLTLVRFANGATLTVKATNFTKDQVLTAVGFGDGRLGLAPRLTHAYWLVNGLVPAFVEGGTDKLPVSDVQRALAAHASKLELALQDKAFELVGQSQPVNLDFELQLSTAYLVDPAFRPEAVERFKAGIASALPQIDATAAGVIRREKDKALHDGDKRWTTIPAQAEVAATDSADLRTLLQPELRRQPAHVVIVGDIGVDQAIASVASTLGAIPAVGETKEEDGALAHFPARNASPTVFTHNGRPDQAIALTAWPTRDFFASPADARTLQVASEIIKQRLLAGLREVDGATYSPQAEADASQTIKGYGYLGVAVEIPPAKLPLFQQRLETIIADLREKPVSPDELDRAKAPLVETRLREQQQNLYWLSALTNAGDQDMAFDAIRTRVSGVQAVSPADLQSVIRKYANGLGYQIIVQPIVK